MRNIDIVYKSREMMERYKSVMLPVFLFISLAGMISSLVSNTLLVFIITLVLLPISQGFITSALKAYRDNGEKIETYEDGLYGLKNWTKLFGTYFTYNFIKGVIFIIEIIIVTTIVFGIFGDQLYEASYYINSGSLMNSYFLGSMMDALSAAIMIIFTIVIPNVIVIIITNIIFDLFFFSTFYLLEEGLKGFEAMGVAKRLMKGHKKQLFMLKLSFFGWMVLSFILSVFLGTTIVTLLGLGDNAAFLIGGLLGVVFNVLFYRIRYQLALTIFYKEVVKGDELDMDGSYEEEPRHVDEMVYEEKHESSQEEFNEDFSGKQLIMGVGIYLPLYFIGMVFIISFIFSFFIQTLGWNDAAFINAWFNFVVDGALLLLAIIMFKNVFISAWHYMKRLTLKDLGRLTLIGYGLTYLVMFVGNLITLILDSNGESANQVAVEALVNNFPLPMIVTTVIFAPLIEEFVFRGIIFRFVRRYNKVLAILVSGFIFGFIHVSNAVFAGDFSQMFQIIPYMFMGFLFAYLYEKSKSIAVPIYLHMFSNLVSILIILLL